MSRTLGTLALAMALAIVPPHSGRAGERDSEGGSEGERYRVGVCDWMVLKRQKVGEFRLARELGCDGVEMDMGSLGDRPLFDNKMRDPGMARLFSLTADTFSVEVGAVAMSGFYGQSFAGKETYRELVRDCLETMDLMGCDVAFLPLGGCGGGWAEDAGTRAEVARRLREVGDMALSRGKVIGIDTPFDAEGNIAFLEEVGSDGIRVFYKFQTAVENGRDIAGEIRALGRERICAIHASNTDGVLLRDDGAMDMEGIKKALDRIGWSGWLFVERSRDTTDVHNVVRNYGENVKYLKEVFQ